MNILEIQPTGRVLDVRHPGTREPIGLKIEFLSLDSPEVMAVERQLRNKALRSGRNTVTVDKLDENEYDLLAAAITGWTWSNGMKLGEDANPQLNRANVEKLFRAAPWIKRQLDEEMKDESGFFVSSESTSENTSGS